jgi:hypothetical protein
MSLRRVLLSFAFLSLGLLSACALRPRYQDMVQQQGGAQATEGQVLMIRVTDPGTGKPIAGAKVVAGTGRERLSAISDAEGRISVPVSKALLEDNPLVEVVLPKGVSRYQFQISRSEEAPAEAPAAPAEAPAAPVEAPNAPAETPAGTDAPGSTPPTPPSTTGTPAPGT